ncbi:Sugar (pentulose and hexulose) kinase [Halapricum desulfuricans]|uniref:Sugar (Pentulose and hexulose) kinase n=2 Tax=Halapricum desulfuricans TaxID=2841257 RepID=A0A897NES9_9EURY|nr:Sugar (pentulose and hexulose) kinase [Halapricum desulfuricans]
MGLPMTDVLIGVDAGTSMIKAVAYTTEGQPLYKSSRKNEVLRPESGWREQDMDDTWDATAATLREVAEQLNPQDEILGLGVTGQGDGCWLIDDEGQPVRDAILWHDERASDIIGEWQETDVNEQLYDVCGSVQFPGSSLAILLWLQEHETETIMQADTVFFSKDWLKYRLTGEVTSDPSDMSLPYVDVETGEYSSEVFEIVDAPQLESLLPPLHDPLDVIGEVTTEAAKQTDIPAGTPVVSGLFDVPCSMFGSGVSHAGEGASVVGTTSLNQVLMDEPDPSPDGVGMTLSLGLDGENGFGEQRWTRVMASMIGTPNLDWWLDMLRYREDPDYAAIEKRASEIPIGSEGVLYHPYLSGSGERAPFLNTKARAQMIGLEPDHTEEHIVRAVYEGVGMAMKDCYEHIPDTPEEVYVAGGGANSDFWCQMFADAIDAEFAVPEGEEFGAKGAALLAGAAVGVFDDFQAAVRESRTVEQTYQTDPAASEKYDKLYQYYKHTYETMFDIWDKRVETMEAIERIDE